MPTPSEDDYDIAKAVFTAVLDTVEKNAESYDQAAGLIRAYVERVTATLTEESSEKDRLIGMARQRELSFEAENAELRETIQAVLGISTIPQWLRERCALVLIKQPQMGGKNEQ